jgi:hypothetical protein
MTNETTQNKQSKAEQILSELKVITTPAIMEEFTKNVERFARLHKICGKAELWFDENPHVEVIKLDADIVYTKEYHIDELICDDKKFEIETEYEMYTVGEGYYTTHIIHSFKPLGVKEKVD